MNTAMDTGDASREPLSQFDRVPTLKSRYWKAMRTDRSRALILVADCYSRARSFAEKMLGRLVYVKLANGPNDNPFFEPDLSQRAVLRLSQRTPVELDKYVLKAIARKNELRRRAREDELTVKNHWWLNPVTFARYGERWVIRVRSDVLTALKDGDNVYALRKDGTTQAVWPTTIVRVRSAHGHRWALCEFRSTKPTPGETLDAALHMDRLMPLPSKPDVKDWWKKSWCEWCGDPFTKPPIISKFEHAQDGPVRVLTCSPECRHETRLSFKRDRYKRDHGGEEPDELCQGTSMFLGRGIIRCMSNQTLIEAVRTFLESYPEASLKNGRFGQLRKAYESAAASADDVRRREQLVIADLVNVLKEAREILSMCSTRTFAAPEDAEVRALAERLGYGAVISAASKTWADKLSAMGIPGGQHTGGPCESTVKHALVKIDAALVLAAASASADE